MPRRGDSPVSRFLLAVAISVIVARTSPHMAEAQRSSTPTAPASGVPESLAQERSRRISALRYVVALHVPESRSQPVTGRMQIEFSLSDATIPLALDFEPAGTPSARVTSLNGATPDVPLVNGHLLLPAAALQPGPNSVAIDFTAGDTPLNRNDEFLYTIFVPARAHETLPVFDQPDLKARWMLSLDVPTGWLRLSGTWSATT